jgi:molybdate transport system substrate-binding protein
MRKVETTRILSIAAVVLLVLRQPVSANAAEIRVWAARALATVLAEIGPGFERSTGHHLDVSTGLPADFQKRAGTGEPFDVLITGSGPLDPWIREGRILAATRVDVARSGIGVAVRAGARKPDVGSVEAFKRALTGAKSIAYLRVGSGLYVESLVHRLDIAAAIQSKVTRPESDIVCELVGRGEIELGVVVVTQILTTPGVELAGPLPPEIQSYVVFSGGVSASSKAPEAARQLLEFLGGPVASAVIRAQGMEPVP